MGLFRLVAGLTIILMPVLALGNEKFKEADEDGQMVEELQAQPSTQPQTRAVQHDLDEAALPNPIAGKGQKVFTLGFMTANALIGGELEYFLNNTIGLVGGVGLIGAGAGVSLHFYTSQSSDYYFNADAKFPAAFGFMPGLELGARSFYGKNRKIGLAAEVGMGVLTKSGSFESGGTIYSWEKGQSMMTYSLGLAFNL